jgi:hypothetical protein
MPVAGDRAWLEPERLDGEGELKFRLDSYPVDFTLKQLFQYHQDGKLVFPEFQRKFVWNQEKSSKLIESFLANLPVPGVFFFKARDSHTFEVVDGQQRLKSVFHYFENSFPPKKRSFRLKGVANPWNDLTFPELSFLDRNRLEDTVLRATVLKQLDKEDRTGMFEVFRRLNTGGVSLNDQEVRNCINAGAFRESLEELNRLPEWRDVIGRKREDKRLRDVQLLLRSIALSKDARAYSKPMRLFLDRNMDRLANSSPSVQQEVVERTRDTILKIREALGPKAFNLRVGLNPSALDAVFSAVYENPAINRTTLANRYAKLKENADFLELTKDATTDTEVVKERHNLAHTIILG